MDDRMQEALGILNTSRAGRGVLSQSLQHWGFKSETELMQVFRWGPVSKTDAVLTRHFNPNTGKEHRERKVTVYLRRDQSLEDLVLDMAHELTHATAAPSWDPYDPDLTPGKYIWAVIEGGGGEVDALTVECQVSLELSALGRTLHPRCERYRALSGGVSKSHVSREKVLQDFYRVGKWQSDLFKNLGKERGKFPLISGEAPHLYSSTGQAPYPVSLFQEYLEINEIACENSKNRLTQASPGRSPASQDSSNRFIQKRCQRH